jgi:2OG-Fe(II) oxygenase superfamily
MDHGTKPFRWWVIDNWCEPVSISDIPPECDYRWEARYENDLERGKRTTRQIPPAFDFIFNRLTSFNCEAAWCARTGEILERDPTNHGGGLHVTRSGGYLACHLDYDLHPKLTGKRRALNLIAFLNPEWREEWGGALCLCDPMGEVVKRIFPAPGRLAAFETHDTSYHAVGPEQRVSAAVYLLADATGHETRKRALFMPLRHVKG